MEVNIINMLAGIGVYCMVTTISDITKEIYKHFIKG